MIKLDDSSIKIEGTLEDIMAEYITLSEYVFKNVDIMNQYILMEMVNKTMVDIIEESNKHD